MLQNSVLGPTGWFVALGSPLTNVGYGRQGMVT
jgi:hypothetical protein